MNAHGILSPPNKLGNFCELKSWNKKVKNKDSKEKILKDILEYYVLLLKDKIFIIASFIRRITLGCSPTKWVGWSGKTLMVSTAYFTIRTSSTISLACFHTQEFVGIEKLEFHLQSNSKLALVLVTESKALELSFCICRKVWKYLY